MKAPTEFEKNLFFRNGDRHHSFEEGCVHIPEWRGRSEDAVLLERAKLGVKTVAQIVVGVASRDNTRRREALLRKAHKKGLTSRVTTNSYGMEVFYATGCPEKSMKDLLAERLGDPLFSNVELPPVASHKCVGDYLNGFDMSFRKREGKCPTETVVSVLESALLLGYTLDVAAQYASMSQTRTTAEHFDVEHSDSEEEGTSGRRGHAAKRTKPAREKQISKKAQVKKVQKPVNMSCSN